MMDWIFEGGWFLYSSLLVFMASMVLLWFFQRNNLILIFAAMPVVAAGVFLLADTLVVTDREQCVATLKEIEFLVNNRRLDSCVDLLDERFVTRGGMNKSALRNWFEKNRSGDLLERCVFWGDELVQATQVDTLKLSTMVKIRGKEGIYREGIYRIEFVFVKNKDKSVGRILSFKIFDPLTNDNEINPGI